MEEVQWARGDATCWWGGREEPSRRSRAWGVYYCVPCGERSKVIEAQNRPDSAVNKDWCCCLLVELRPWGYVHQWDYVFICVCLLVIGLWQKLQDSAPQNLEEGSEMSQGNSSGILVQILDQWTGVKNLSAAISKKYEQGKSTQS